MKDSKPGDTLIVKGDKFILKQFPNNVLERNEILNIAIVVGVWDKYLSNPRMQHWKAVKCVMHYLKRTKGYMLTYRMFEGLEIIRYSDSNFARCQDSKCSTYGYIYMLVIDDIKRLLKIYYDNKSFIPITTKVVQSQSLSTSSFWVIIERVQNKQIFIKHIGTIFMLADSLTKELIPKVFHEYIA
ncbi:hypothetical protein CR513_28109, partial [Mucuna pruriens]